MECEKKQVDLWSVKKSKLIATKAREKEDGN